MRITQGTETVGALPRGTLFLTQNAAIVHVNLASRIATIRNGNSFEDGAFLIVKDQAGQQSAVLKALPARDGGLRTADLLEGEPQINHSVVLANEAEAARYAQIYRDPEGE